MVRPGVAGLVLVFGLAAVAGGPAHAAERPRPMGLYAASGPALAMLESRIDLTVRGPVIEAVVVQRFRNPIDRATEATYIFPLPADAAVSAMAIRIGSRTIRAAIERREAAQQRYEAAVAAGLAAALLDQERPDVFTQAVSAIPPGGVVEVTLRYDSLARYESGIWELVVPMVVGPRHVPGTASGRATTGSGRAADTDRAPDASRVTPAAAPGAGGSTRVAIHFVDEPAELTSPSHELHGSRRDATLSDPRSDRDAVVRWRAPLASAGWIERAGDGGFAAVVVEAPPPGPRPPNQRPALRMILAIDRSATTRGDADIVERPLVRALLGQLAAGDRVRLLDATGATGAETIAWRSPGDAAAALERSWAAPARPFDLTRVLAGARPEGVPLVVISDGLIADDPAAIAAARRLGVAVHTVGIGPTPARATLRQIAAVSGGTVRFAVAGDDLGALANSVLADVAAPPAPIAVQWGTLDATDVVPPVLPRLGAGQAMLVIARIKRAPAPPQAANARVRGALFAFESLGPARPVDGATTGHGALARRWARERLGDLLLGPADRNAVTAHALAYGLVSPYTSLVAIGSDVIVEGGVTRSIAVPVSLPSGMHWHAVKQATTLDVSAAPPAEPAPPPPTVATAPPPPPPPPPPGSPSSKPGKRPPSEGPARPPAPPRDAPPSEEALAPEAGEVIVITGSAVSRRESNTAAPVSVVDATELARSSAGASLWPSGSSPYGRVRLSAALAGGLAFDGGTRGLVALDVRLDTTGRFKLGLDGGLAIAGDALSGRALVTLAREAGRWLELGAGVGSRFGNGVGVAGVLHLRLNTPWPWLAGALRYDAGLVNRPGAATEQAITVGAELSY